MILFPIFQLLSGMNREGPAEDDDIKTDNCTKMAGCARGLPGWLYNCQMGFFIAAAIQLILIGTKIKKIFDESLYEDMNNYDTECGGLGCMEIMMDNYGSMAVQCIVCGVMFL